MTSLDSFKCCRILKVGTKSYAYFSLPIAEKNGLKGISRLPFSMKVLLENLLRNEDGRTVTKEAIQAVAAWLKTKSSDREIAFRPARVLMPDYRLPTEHPHPAAIDNCVPVSSWLLDTGHANGALAVAGD